MRSFPGNDTATGVRALTAGRPWVQSLPAELSLRIAGLLSQKDLRRFSRCSRDCYTLATDAGLYIPRTVRWDSFEEAAFRVSLEKLNQVIDYAANIRSRLNIGIDVVFSNSTAAAVVPVARRSMLSVQRALPYLVRLHISFPAFVSDAVYEALCADSAPKLSYLSITHEADDPLRTPPNLFNGAAEKLRKVTLKLTDVRSLSVGQPIAVFQSVTHLKLSVFRPSQRLALARTFPSLQKLALFCSQSPAAGNIDLSGLELRYLALSGPTAMLNDASQVLLQDIPVIEQYLYGATAVPVWPAHADEICGVAELWTRHGYSAVSLVPRDGSRRRTLAPFHRREVTLPLADITILATKLVSFTLPGSVLNAFVEAPVTLDGLRELCIDISPSGDGFIRWGPQRGGLAVKDHIHFEYLKSATPRVHCPALARLVVFARPAANPVVIFEERIVPLARALGLRGCRPALTLSGCAWHPAEPPVHSEILDLVSAVHLAECSADCVPKYYDMCRYSGYFDTAEWDTRINLLK
ncbi:hypothetical protein AURDEDRAFT_131189 [Auricularia subglabra TFB-10046 SS5]|uniref:F-box domain-containing protein n=1 Tax=Auricularia subglabra (strain TFB-10046 / SS5) TaxID=717982 RepID=J0D6C9_AURST|nr:hypothetical protein AURDEDRAFT_131189 [Auricularia subglabra TFB-10046 SS5]